MRRACGSGCARRRRAEFPAAKRIFAIQFKKAGPIRDVAKHPPWLGTQ